MTEECKSCYSAGFEAAKALFNNHVPEAEFPNDFLMHLIDTVSGWYKEDEPKNFGGYLGTGTRQGLIDEARRTYTGVNQVPEDGKRIPMSYACGPFPEMSEKVVVWYTDSDGTEQIGIDHMEMASVLGGGEIPVWVGYNHLQDSITHWMPLPKS